MEKEETEEKIKFFFDNKITVHIVNKSNSWFNGLILELSDSMLVINDRLLGECPLGLSEITKIERFTGHSDTGGKDD